MGFFCKKYMLNFFWMIFFFSKIVMACFCEKNDVRNRLHSSNFAHFYTRIITTHSLYKTFVCVRIFLISVNSPQLQNQQTEPTKIGPYMSNDIPAENATDAPWRGILCKTESKINLNE